jgi:hypothetical protein
MMGKRIVQKKRRRRDEEYEPDENMQGILISDFAKG